jgi:hypothetical protein
MTIIALWVQLLGKVDKIVQTVGNLLKQQVKS